jgi:hypothetical protein
MAKFEVLTKVILTVAVLVLVIIVLVHVYLLGVGVYADQFYTFWLPMVIMGLIVFYSVLRFRSCFPLVLIVIFALALHLIQVVREPSNLVWNPDSIYGLQLVNHVNATGHWSYSYGTGEAFGYSFYPLVYIFESILSTVTSFSSLICIQYSMAFINVLTLLTFYALINGLFKLGARTKNLMIFFFALSPGLNGFDSYTNAESFAIILLPLALLFILRPLAPNLLKSKGSNRSIAGGVVAVFLLLTITMTHPFTAYMLAFSLLIPLVLVYLVFKEYIGRRNLILLAIILPLAWLTFVAGYIFQSQLGWLVDVIRSLTSVRSLVGYTYRAAETAAQTYPSIFSQQLSLLRNVLIVVVPLVGLLWYSKIQEKKAYKYFKFLLLSFLTITIFLLYFVNWSQISVADIRERIVEFAYFPIAFFFPLGLAVLSERIGRFRQNYSKNTRRIWKFLLKPTAVTLFIAVLMVSTVMQAYPRFMYDSTYKQPITISEFPVAAENQYALGLWIALHVNSSSPNIEFAGSSSSQDYVLGYGLFQGQWLGTLNETELSTELSTSTPHSVFYVLNSYNLNLTDQYGVYINSSTVNFLNANFSRLYDNGPIVLYEYKLPYPQT